MRTGVPCNENRVFPVGIDLQGFPVSYTGFGFAVQQLISCAVCKKKGGTALETTKDCKGTLLFRMT